MYFTYYICQPSLFKLSVKSFCLFSRDSDTAEGALRGNRLLKIQWSENGNTSLGKFLGYTIKTPKQCYLLTLDTGKEYCGKCYCK